MKRMKSLSLVKLFKLLTSVLAIPLFPCIFNVLVKIFCRVKFGWVYFDGATFCLTIALYSLSVMGNIYRSSDKKIKDDLVRPYKFVLLIFFCIYILSLTADTTFLKDMVKYIASIKSITLFSWFDSVKCKVPDTLYVSEGVFSQSETGIHEINSIALIVGIGWLCWSERIRRKYKIEGGVF